MSSGFVSAGTTEKPAERDDAWLKAQAELEAARQRREEAKQDDGKSLYEVLQANKAAKQEAFEESIRLKNQFRNLDDDEVDFLDSILESTRAREDALNKETSEQLELFRRHQEEADQRSAANDLQDDVPRNLATADAQEQLQWAANPRKRRRAKENETPKGVKLRRSSSGVQASPIDRTLTTRQDPVQTLPEQVSEIQGASSEPKSVGVERKFEPPIQQSSPNMKKPSEVEDGKLPSKTTLGLGGYSSNED